jgi:predicted CXXCH cytochrome family protein
MRIPKLLVLSAVAAIGWAGIAAALDAPHDGAVFSSVTECQSCHKLHASSGGTMLNGYSTNNDACITCHGAGTTNNNLFQGGWATGRESSVATPGAGDQHNWSGVPTGAGAQRPTDLSMVKYLPSDTTALQCAVCHDVHGKRDATGSIQKTLAPSSAHASYRYNVAQNPLSTTGMTLMLRPVAVGAKPQGFRIKTTGATTFQISHDYEAKLAAVPPGTPTWSANLPYNTTADANLDDGALVQVRFGGTAATGHEWSFYVSYPFLRTANDLDQMCLDCHRDRVMDHLCVEGTGVGCTADGAKVFSHPVNQALNANLKNYDIASGVPLDADGAATSSSTDGEGGVPNPGNDLKLVGAQVRCTTCHAPHNADSNSLTVDVR